MGWARSRRNCLRLLCSDMHTDAFNHAPAQIQMNTGSQMFGRPSLGAWTIYGLGTESQELPAFVVFSTGGKGTSGGASNWGAGFLPSFVVFSTGGKGTSGGASN